MWAASERGEQAPSVGSLWEGRRHEGWCQYACGHVGTHEQSCARHHHVEDTPRVAEEGVLIVHAAHREDADEGLQREERREEFKEKFEERWENSSEEERAEFCDKAKGHCDDGAKHACDMVEARC